MAPVSPPSWDTNVISELRKPAGRAATNVRVWAGRRRTSDLLISVITVMEIEIGIARLERRDSVQGDVLRKWLERDLLAAFATRNIADFRPLGVELLNPWDK